MMDSDTFRRLLSRFASGIAIITARDGERDVGMTVSAFCSVSLSPPLVLVCVDRGASMHDLLLRHPKLGISIVAWPLESGKPKPDWKPGTDTIDDIRPGSFLERSYEERQRKPDDLEAQEGQRPIAIHALENLAHSDTGIVMLRRLLREQLKRVEQGLDPINVMRALSANKRIPTGAWNTILSPAEAATLPYTEDL